MLGNLLKYKSFVYNYIKPLQELIAFYFVISIKQSEDTHLQLLFKKRSKTSFQMKPRNRKVALLQYRRA